MDLRSGRVRHSRGVGWDGTVPSPEAGGSPVVAAPTAQILPTHPPFDEGMHRAEEQ